MASFAPGSRLGPYEPIDKIGAGGMPSAPRELFRLRILEMGWSPYEVAPDGNRFLVRATSGQASSPLTVIVNWPALLKREPQAQ
jgi:hypothetical protein